MELLGEWVAERDEAKLGSNATAAHRNATSADTENAAAEAPMSSNVSSDADGPAVELLAGLDGSDNRTVVNESAANSTGGMVVYHSLRLPIRLSPPAPASIISPRDNATFSVGELILFDIVWSENATASLKVCRPCM